jgi:hypothetical protein
MARWAAMLRCPASKVRDVQGVVELVERYRPRASSGGLQLRRAVLAVYDRMLGLELEQMAQRLGPMPLC